MNCQSTFTWLNMRFTRSMLIAAILSCCTFCINVYAHVHAHVHGLAQLNVLVDDNQLTLDLDVPLESLLGFEHSPRNDSQRQAVNVLMQQLNQSNTLVQPDESGICVRQSIEVTSPASISTNHHAQAHADLSYRVTFTCAQINKVGFIQLGFFRAFSRLETIQTQIATSKRQFKQTLKRPNEVIKLLR